MARSDVVRRADPASESRATQPRAAEGVYSIGAVARMLGLRAATLRTWEDRYGVVAPERTSSGHRIYARSQIEQLRSVMAEMGTGASAADAHRSLKQRISKDVGGDGRAARRSHVLVLVAERDQYGAEPIEYLLRVEGCEVVLALDGNTARRRFELNAPDLVIVEPLMSGGEGEAHCRWLKAQGARHILAISSLDAADRALSAGADAFLRKPVGHEQLLSTVNGLLGVSAVLVKRG